MEPVRFEDLGVDERILRAVTEMGFEEATPIQAKAIPEVMTGQDIIGQAQTGTGKTASFGIPMLQKVDPKNKHVQAIVLCPTRELAIQSADEIRKLADESKESTDEIKKIITEITEKSKLVESTMQENEVLQTEQQEAINRTEEIFGEIMKQIEMLGSGMERINALNDTMSANKDLVVDKMGTIASVSEQDRKSVV